MKNAKRLLSLLLSVLLVMSTFTVVLADEEVADASKAQLTPVELVPLSENNIGTSAKATRIAGGSQDVAGLMYFDAINDGKVGIPSDSHLLSDCVENHAKKFGIKAMYQHRVKLTPTDGVVSVNFKWNSLYQVSQINIYERNYNAEKLTIESNNNLVYSDDSFKGDVAGLISHTPKATIDDVAWEKQNGTWITETVGPYAEVGKVYFTDLYKHSIPFASPILTSELTFTFETTAAQVEIYEIEVIGTPAENISNIASEVSSVTASPNFYNSTNTTLGMANLYDGLLISPGTGDPNYAKRTVLNKPTDKQTIDGVEYFKGTLTFTFDNAYDIYATKLHTLTRANTTFAKIKVLDANYNILVAYDVDESDTSKYPTHSGYTVSHAHPMQVFNKVTTNTIILEYYLSSVGDQVWFAEFEIYGTEVESQIAPDPEMSIKNNIALTSPVDVLGATSTTAQMLESNINDGLTISPAADADDKSYYKGERTVAYVDAFADATIDGVSYKEGYVHYYFNGLADIAGFKFYDVGNPAIKKVIAKDYDGNVLASYDVDATKYPISDGYFTSRAHTAVAFAEIKELAGIYIYYYIDAASTATEIWLAEVEVFGQSKNDPAYINVASTPNGGSVHASNVSRGHIADLNVCSCYKYTAADGKETGILGDTRYINDGSLGAKTDPNSTCTNMSHRFFTQQNLPEGENLILNFGFEQKSKVDTIIVYAKSCIDHGHINTLKVYNGDTLLTTYIPEYGNSCSAVRYIITLPAPVVTDSLKLEMVPQRDNFIYNGTERVMINKKIEFFEVEIYGIKSTFDISNGEITAKDISNTQGACLIVAEYTNNNKNELKAVEFVPLTNGEATYTVPDTLTNYKVFFTDGLNGLISYKVIEG